MTDLLTACKQKGSDRKFLQWIRTLPSCIDGTYSEWIESKGEWRNPACHVRRVSYGAGTAIKPPYSAIPMTNEEHKIQTDNGELACLRKYMNAHDFWLLGNQWETPKEAAAKQWFDNEVIHYRKLWVAS